MDQEGKAFTQSKLEMVQMVPVDMIDLSNAIDGETPKKKTKTEENQGSSDEDLMAKWFSQGLYPHILERIFGGLTMEAKFNCLSVSPVWKEMSKFYRVHLYSNEPRFEQNVQQACSKLWDSKTPVKAKLEKVYANSGYNVTATMDMVMDDYNLIISTAVDIKDPNAPHNSRTKLMVLDSHDFSFIRALDVDSCFNFKSASPMTVKMALTPNHLVANVFTNTSKLIQLMYDRNNDYACTVIFKEEGLGDKDTNSPACFTVVENLPRPCINGDKIKFMLSEKYVTDGTQPQLLESSFQNPSEITRKDLTLFASLPILATFPVPGTDNYLLREYNYRGGDSSKLDYYDGEGNLLWQVSKPRSFLNVIAINHNHAAVTWRMQTQPYGRGPTEIHIHNLKDGSVSEVIEIPHSEVGVWGSFNSGQLALKVNIYSPDKDVIFVNTRTKSVTSLMEKFGIKGYYSTFLVRHNKFIVADGNDIYSFTV